MIALSPANHNDYLRTEANEEEEEEEEEEEDKPTKQKLKKIVSLIDMLIHWQWEDPDALRGWSSSCLRTLHAITTALPLHANITCSTTRKGAVMFD